MGKAKSKSLIPLERIERSILLIRGNKVILDRDLARLYGIETKVLKQAVRRNRKRFLADFMLELTKEEFNSWRSQIVTSNSDRMGWRHPPMAFIEQGVAMLSSVLSSTHALHHPYTLSTLRGERGVSYHSPSISCLSLQ